MSKHFFLSLCKLFITEIHLISEVVELMLESLVLDIHLLIFLFHYDGLPDVVLHLRVVLS